jgi:uncharacterized protein
MVHVNLELPRELIIEFCRRWEIVELALFGSVLREDFGRDSDLDVLVTFAPRSRWTLLDHVQMQEELKGIVGRPVDLVSRKGIERSRNALRKKAILNSAEVYYAAA